MIDTLYAEENLNILLITNNPVPKVGSGGPGAVVTNLIKGLNEFEKEKMFNKISINYISGYGKTSNLARTRTIISKIISNYPMLFILTLFLHNNLILKRRIKNTLNKISTKNLIIHAHDILSLYSFLPFKKKLNPKYTFLSIHSPGSALSEMKRKWSTARTFPLFKKLSLQIIRNIEVRVILNADHLILPSHATLKSLVDDYPMLSVNKMSVVNNGIYPLHGKKGFLRKELSLSNDDTIVVSIGNLISEKGFDVLIKAIKLISKKSNKVSAVIVGNGPLMANLQDLIHSLGISKRVFLLGYRKDVPNILADADIFVSSSRFSAFDLSILEAMSMGLPIIATNVGGNPEAVKDAAILIAPEDYTAISKSILKISSDKELGRSLSLKAKKLYLDKYTIESMTSNYIKIYKMMNDNSLTISF